MSPDVSILLAGPRGRRLCLALAYQDQHDTNPEAAELWRLLFYASHHRETARGQGGTIFGWGMERPLPDPTVREIADALDKIPLTALSSVGILRALAASVDSARYWQEPDGQDELLLERGLSVGLQRIAAHVVGSPSTSWWSDVMAPEQWTVQFRDDHYRLPATLSAEDALRQWRDETAADEQRAIRDRPADPTAMFSGEWWSKPPSALTSTTRWLPDFGPAGLWLIEDRSDQEPADVCRVAYPDAAGAFEITGAASWAELCREYPLDVTATRRHDWYRATGRAGRWVIPNWSQVARDFDAVHLTLAAYLSAAGTSIPLGDDSASVISGWNPDETYWLTDVTAETAIHSTWMHDQDGERWNQIEAR